MKIGDLVIVRMGRCPTLFQKLRHHLGVIVAMYAGSEIDVRDRVLIAWTNGEQHWSKGSWVIPYEGYAGKKHNDIK